MGVFLVGDARFSWLALQVSVCLPLLIQFKLNWRAFPAQIFGSLLLGIGFWYFLPTAEPLLHRAGVVLLIVGIGGMLGWLPIPQGDSPTRSPDELLQQFSTCLIPVCLAAVLVNHSIRELQWSERELAILAVISLLSLATCGLRLLGPLTIEQRCRITQLTILGNANIASVLMGWELLHPGRDWSHSTNLPTGLQLFYCLLLLESLAVLLLNVGLSRILPNSESPLPEASLVALGKLKFLNLLSILCGALSLAGLPPFPGSWWRFGLLSALILPQQTSIVTQVSEPHDGFIMLTIAYAGVSLLIALGQARLFRLMVMAPLEAAATQESVRPEMSTTLISS